MQVCDVGGGTGFCTLGVVETVKPENVTLVDQSPHQLSKAKAKAPLQKVTILEVPLALGSHHVNLSIVSACMSQRVVADISKCSSGMVNPFHSDLKLSIHF